MRLEPVTLAEESLLAAVRQGEPWTGEFHRKFLRRRPKGPAPDVHQGQDADAKSKTAASGASGKHDAERTVSADLIRKLILQDNDRMARGNPSREYDVTRKTRAEKDWLQISARGLILEGESKTDKTAIPFRPLIIGSLDLSAVEFPRPLKIVNCDFEDSLILDEAHLKSLNLSGSEFTQEEPEGALISGGQVRIDANLCFNKLKVAGINLYGIQIGGTLELSGARISSWSPNEHAIEMDGATISGTVAFADKCVVDGGISLVRARIGGTLNFISARICHKHSAIDAAHLRVGGSVYFQAEFSSKGELSFSKAVIQGDLIANGATFRADHGLCFNGDSITIDGRLHLQEKFRSFGTIRMIAARVQNEFSISDSILESRGPFERAISAERLDLKNSLYIRGATTITGQTDFGDAHINGNVHIYDSELKPQNARNEGVVLSFSGAQIVGDLNLADPYFSRWQSNQGILGGTDLRDCSARTLCDGHSKPPALHRAVNRISQSALKRSIISSAIERPVLLDGFVYDRISRQAATAPASRIAWLKRQPKQFLRGDGFAPQPWDQLIHVYHKMGMPRQARQIAIAKEDHVVAHGGLRGLARIWRAFLGWSVRYGYSATRPLALSMFLILFGWMSFAAADQAGWMTESPPIVSIQRDAPGAMGAVPPFNAFMYSVDVFLPLAEFGQQNAWRPGETGGPIHLQDSIPLGQNWIPDGAWGLDTILTHWVRGGGLKTLQWLMIAVGWIASALIAANLSGVMKQD